MLRPHLLRPSSELSHERDLGGELVTRLPKDGLPGQVDEPAHLRIDVSEAQVQGTVAPSGGMVEPPRHGWKTPRSRVGSIRSEPQQGSRAGVHDPKAMFVGYDPLGGLEVPWALPRLSEGTRGLTVGWIVPDHTSRSCIQDKDSSGPIHSESLHVPERRPFVPFRGGPESRDLIQARFDRNPIRMRRKVPEHVRAGRANCFHQLLLA